MKIVKSLMCLVVVALMAAPTFAQSCSGGGGGYNKRPGDW